MAKVDASEPGLPSSRETPMASAKPLGTVANAHIVSLRLLFTGWISHFRSPGYMKDETMQILDKAICKKSVDLSVKDVKLREAIGSEPKIWHDLVDLFRAACPSFEHRSYGTSTDQMGQTYEGPNSNIIVTNSTTLLKDLQRLDSILTLARNVLTVGDKVQNLAASVGFDKEICHMINLCIKVTARGYDGDGSAIDEDKWQGVINGFKKLLITSLQFLSNLITLNERLKLMLWVEFFDSTTDPVSSSLSYRHLAPLQSSINGRDINSPKAGPREPVREPVNSTRPLSKAELHRRKADTRLNEYLAWYDSETAARGIGNTDDLDDAVLHEINAGWEAKSDNDKKNWLKAQGHVVPPSPPSSRPPLGRRTMSERLEGKLIDHGLSKLRLTESQGDVHRRPSDATSSSSGPQRSEPLLDGNNQFSSSFQNKSCVLESAADGAKKLQEGKTALLKRLDNPPEPGRAEPTSSSPLISPSSPVDDTVNNDGLDDDDGEDEGSEEEQSSEEEDEEEEEEEDEEDYAMPGEDGRGLLTDVPLILGPNEIEILPMIIMSGIVAPAEIRKKASKDDPKSAINMYTIRCHLLLAQENGRNLLRELLIFVAAWDLREEELYFKFMVKILEAILMNGLMPFAYTAFKESKDIISPAQAVIMKLLTKIFHARQGFIGPASHQLHTPFPDPLNPSSLEQPLRYDVQIVHCLFSEFRQQIIPQMCALIFLQGQIRQGYAGLDEFPLNLWDMERMYEGVYQYLEFFAILTDHDDWKQLMADWEVTSELITLLRELDIAIPKGRHTPTPLNTQVRLPAQENGTSSPQPPSKPQPPSQSPEPVSVERPYDIAALPSADPTVPPPLDGTTPSPYPEPIHDEPADFEWRNLKKLCVLVLSSLCWKTPRLQDQIRSFGGITALLSCCEDDEHNPYIREHAIMCLRFLMEGNPANHELLRQLGRGELPDDDPLVPVMLARYQARDAAYTNKSFPVPMEVLDHNGYETFMDARGQVGLRRKEGVRGRAGKGIMLEPGGNLPEWMQRVMSARARANAGTATA
ncbi:MAG: copper transport protein [Chrysothrix sp. TS-e1954]|nr:MAG: copper transport protein [Chrysothrix sp. TS-e1954]